MCHFTQGEKKPFGAVDARWTEESGTVILAISH